MHDWVVTPNNSLLLGIYQPVKRDLRPYGGKGVATMLDAVLQEVDPQTGLVMYEWHTLGHVSPKESYFPVKGGAWDPYHFNCIHIAKDESITLSHRNTHTGYNIDKATGQVNWRLGGKKSSFALGKDARFAWQHHIEWHDGKKVTLYDNRSAAGYVAGTSRGQTIDLDVGKKKASLDSEIRHHPQFVASSQGSAQLLPNGNMMIGWGSRPHFSEHGPSGKLLFEATLPSPLHSYRAYRFDWKGHPTSSPSVAVSRARGSKRNVHASWNGATEVKSWQVLAGKSKSSLAPVGSPQKRSGFETTISAPSSGRHFAVRALDKSGNVIKTSRTVSA